MLSGGVCRYRRGSILEPFMVGRNVCHKQCQGGNQRCHPAYAGLCLFRHPIFFWLDPPRFFVCRKIG